MRAEIFYPLFSIPGYRQNYMYTDIVQSLIRIILQAVPWMKEGVDQQSTSEEHTAKDRIDPTGVIADDNHWSHKSLDHKNMSEASKLLKVRHSRKLLQKDINFFYI